MTNELGSTAGVRLAEGDLAGALDALQQDVRSHPENPDLRVFLFQLLCVLGDWNRAITQLKLCAQMQAKALPMAQAYREAIICEVFREKVFAGERDPLIFGEPEEWLALLIEANKLLAGGKPGEAAILRERAFDEAAALPGDLDGQSFDWIADADSRLGPVLEVIINGRYFWLPFSSVVTLKIEPPADLRDAVWTAGQLTLKNGGEHPVLIPTRYPDTVAQGSDAQKLARATEWQDAGGGAYTGLGQRLLATDQGDVALMDARVLSLSGGDDGMGDG